MRDWCIFYGWVLGFVIGYSGFLDIVSAIIIFKKL